MMVAIEDKKEMFEFLTTLRKSGQLNMWESVPHLQNEFFLDKPTAKQVFFDWIEFTRSNQ
jgi:hypothetical protein